MKIDRLVSIILILLDKKRIGAQDLSEIFGVSSRTIYRDIETINLSGIPVCSIPGVGGGFEIMENYKIDKNVFSANDLSAILMGLSSVSNMIREDELFNALAKVKSFIPADRAKDIEFKANQFCIDLRPWMGNRNIEPYLETIKKAMQEGMLLVFDYIDRYGNKTARTVEPYQLVLKSSHWYCHGYCKDRNDFRLFKLTRVAKLKIIEVSFTPRNYIKPHLEFDDILDAIQSTIKIRIHSSISEKILDFCSNEDLLPDGDEYCIANFPFIENDYFYNILFSLGSKCECLEPLHVRTELKRRIGEIAALYERKKSYEE